MSKKHKHKEPQAVQAPEPAPVIPGRVRAWLPLAGLLLLVTFMRFNLVLWEPLIFPDSLQYMHLAKEIRSGEFFARDYDLDQGFIKSRHIPPFYSLLLAPFAGTSLDLEAVGHLISILLGIYTIIPLYFLAASVFSRREALIAGLMFCFHSLANKFASPVLTESTFTALYLTVIWLALTGLRRGSWPALFGAGAVSALGYMTRDVGISSFAVAAAGVVVWHVLVERRPWRSAVVPTAAVLAGFLLVASPYLIDIRLRTGHWGLTLQLSDSSITEQVQLYGGDRFDRDRLSVQEKQTKLVGGEPVGGPLGLLRIAPAVAVKVVRNSYKYVRELMTKAQSLPLFLFLAGLLAVGLDFRAGRDRRRLFEQLWPAVWTAQLLFLYALVTPYMVDVRYMGPILPLLFILAARGITFTADEASRSNRPAWPFLAAAVLFVIFIIVYASWTDNEPYARLDLMLPKRWDPIAFLFTPLSVSLLFGTVLLGLLPGPLAGLDRWPAGRKVIAGAMVTGLGLALILGLAFAGRDLNMVSLGAFLAGPGIAMLLRGLTDGGRRPRLVTVTAVAGTLLFLAPDLIYQWNWYSSKELSGKYASGYKEAAAALKQAGLVQPGKQICSRKPFIAYYLDGKWYLNEDGEPVPKRDEELLELVAQGKIDYLALDTFTLKNLRPALLQRSLAIEPIPGATLIYGRYFPEYKRLITIYDCRRNDPGVPRRASAAEHFAAAQQYFDQNLLPFALRELNSGIALDSHNADAWLLIVRILTIYYDCCARPDVPSLVLIPQILPAVVNAAKNVYALRPDSPDARATYLRAENIFAEEQAEMQRMTPAVNNTGSGAGANNND